MSNQDDRLFDDIVERELFLDIVAHGTPETLAGHEVGWTPRQTQRNLADPAFAELVAYARTRRDDGVEKVLYEVAMKGNMNAIAMILLNRRGSEFKDIKRIEVRNTHEVKGEIVHSVKQAALELMREGSIEGLQWGGALDAIETTSRED